MRTETSYEQFALLAGTELGASDWQRIDQALIDRFADLSGDHGFPHVDTERAKATPFGGTIAHGLLVLSLVGGMTKQVIPAITDRQYLLAYGWEHVRFTAPVKSGVRIRSRVRMVETRVRSELQRLVRFAITVEIESEPKPAMLAEFLQLVTLREVPGHA